MKTQAIIATAGMGTRLKSPLPKPLLEVCGKPLCVYTLEIFGNSPCIDSIILVVAPDYLVIYERLVRDHQLKKVDRIVAGGDSRYESVHNGLKVLDQDTDCVVIHDGARPLVRSELLRECVLEAQAGGAAVVGVPVKSTIKRVDAATLVITETLRREELWEIQTPQAFRAQWLRDAYGQSPPEVPTDDATLVEKAGHKVKIIRGDYRNIKITTEEDLIVMEAFLQRSSNQT